MSFLPARLQAVLRSPHCSRASRALWGLLMLAGLLALAAAGWSAWRDRQEAQTTPPPPQASAADEAEARALRERFIAAGEASHRAWIANTLPEVRKAQEAKALEEFQAAQNEVRVQQALAAQRHAEREGGPSSAR